MSKLSAKLFTVLTIVAATLTGYAFAPTGTNSAASAVVSDNPVYEELIINIPALNQKNNMDVAQAIAAHKGVEFKGYCEKYQLLMFVVDRDQQPSNTFLEETMHHQGMDFFIKEGATIAMMNADCGLDTNPTHNQE